MNNQINWDAISAVGQAVGAIITAIAVIIALRKDKPILEFDAPLIWNGNCSVYQVIVSNIGYIPVTIAAVTSISYNRHAGYPVYKMQDTNYIEPGRQRIIAEIDLGHDSMEEAEKVWEHLCIVDHRGNAYFITPHNFSNKIKQFIFIRLPIMLKLRGVPRVTINRAD